ncbi:hypothetical protein L7F22_045160 [Adiantum nelumboides]|nr:hypothetical protein [Adiantum nelumboides]
MGSGSEFDGFDPHGTQDGGLFIVVVFSAVLAVCVGLSLQLSRRLSARGRLPPGPPAWPVIGNFHLLGAMPHQSLTQLARRYGPLMSMRLGSTLYIVASTPEMARYFLQTYDHSFASRPRTAAATHILFNSTNLAFAPYGPYWTLIRRACVNDVFHPKRLLSFQPIRRQETRNLIHGLVQQSRSGQPIVLRPHLQGAANNIISRMTLGKTYIELSSSGSAGDIVGLIDEIMHLLGVPNVGDFIPSLAWLDLQGWERKMRAVREQVKVALGRIIREWRERNAELGLAPAADQPQDFLDALLSMQKSEREVEITDDNVTAVILDMYLGGTDTTSITSEWALAELLANPACLEKVQEELDRVVGRERPVEDGDIAQLPYLRAVVQETFRLHPALPLLLPRQAMQACSVAGYDLPANARVYVNVWAIGRDPETWEEPLAFRPERFLGSTVEEKGKHFQLLPFGSGRRRCVGYELGLLNVRLFLSSLLQSFHWQLPPGVIKPDFTEQFGLSVTLANCLTVQAAPRLPMSAYA